MSGTTSMKYEGLEKYFDMVTISSNKIYNAARKTGAKAVQPELKHDLYQSGMIALMEAWNNFDPAQASFRTYAFYRIRGAMLDHLRNEDTVSRSTRTALKKISMNINNKMTSAELSEEEITKAIKNSVAVFQYVAPGEEGCEHFVEFPDPSDGYTPIDAQETVSKLLQICPLSVKEKTILTEHYFNNKNFSVIGESLGITESRVSQIHKALLLKLGQYV